MNEQDRNRGWYGKYIIEKVDGTPIDPQAEYFVLRIDKDPAARIAAMAYAEAIRETAPQLSIDIIQKCNLYGSRGKIYVCNEGGVAEYCVAEDKKQAYEFMSSLWGEQTMKEYETEYVEDNNDSTIEDFIDDFFTELPPDKEFTISDAGEGGEPITKKISEWMEGIMEVPSYFCCENY